MGLVYLFLGKVRMQKRYYRKYSKLFLKKNLDYQSEKLRAPNVHGTNIVVEKIISIRLQEVFEWSRQPSEKAHKQKHNEKCINISNYSSFDLATNEIFGSQFKN